MTLSGLICRYFQARTKTGYSRRFQDEQEDQDLENPEDEICEICIEPMILRERKFKNKDKCSHPFCIDCIINYIQVKLEYENVDKIKCPGLNCNQLLDPISCRSVIGLSLFVKWCDLLCEKAILGVGKSYCPYRNCNVLILNECGGTLKKSQCPNCKNWFCFQCKRVWHAGFGCKESRKWSDRDDIAFGKLVEQYKWTRCPLCRHFVERIEGCRNVKCRCGNRFCHVCGSQLHRCRCDHSICTYMLLVIIILFLCFVWALRVWLIENYS